LKQGDTRRRPSGVIPDRDIVLQITAQDINPRLVTVEDAMTAQPLIANEADDVGEVLQAMRFAGIRRVPVVDVRGSLIGIIAIDDAIDYIAGLLCDITGSIQNEQRQEWRARPVIKTQRAAS
jgi:Mg/Co/Ni transporter MgtE